MSDLKPLPTKPSPSQTREYMRRIIDAYGSATEAQTKAGKLWYPNAHLIADEIASGDVRKGAGVIAALSAQKRWDYNVRLARDAFAGNVHGHTGRVLEKVRAILAGTDPTEILPMGLKTGHFFRSIFDPNDRTAVTVDRHAYDIAAGMRYGNGYRGLSRPDRYDSIVGAYTLAAYSLGEIASTVQAVTWAAQVEEFGGERI